MKYTECGQQRTAIAMAVLGLLGAGALALIIGITVADIYEDGNL